MSTQTKDAYSDSYIAGWIILMFITLLGTLNHIMLPLYGDDVALALGWTGYSLYALLVLAIPFRRAERWAWYSTWILVIGFAAPILIVQEIYTAAYLIGAGVMAFCLLLTRPAFFQKGT